VTGVVNVLKKQGLTYVQTPKENKKEIPKFLLQKSGEANMSVSGFTSDKILFCTSPRETKLSS
jgi:hypothetical protein